MKYLLWGIRGTGDHEQDFSGNGRKAIVILKPLGQGRRLVAEVEKSALGSFRDCVKAVCAFLNKDAKRIDAADIEEPKDGSDLPWNHAAMPSEPVGQTGRTDGGNNAITARWTATDTADRTAGQAYKDCARFTSNEAYLRQLRLDEAHFDVGTAQQLARNNERIKELERQLEQKRAEFMEEMANLITRQKRETLLSMTPLGRSIIADRRRRA